MAPASASRMARSRGARRRWRSQPTRSAPEMAGSRSERPFPSRPDTLAFSADARVNERRFLSLDLLYSVQPGRAVSLYLPDNGLSRGEFAWLIGHGSGGRAGP